MNKRGLLTGLALALAGVLLLAGAGLAQNRGGAGAGQGGRGNQLCTPGARGVCAVGPNNPDNQNRFGNGAGRPQKARGMGRRGGQANPSATQADPQGINP
jgi:hypothetical protein